MSFRNNNSRSNKSFCKVCKDAGKTEKEYTNHSVKAIDRLTGKTVTTCPTLLSQECRYCHEFGHTAKYCQAIADKNKYDKKEKKEMKPQAVVKETSAVNKCVRFAELAYDSDEEEVTPTPISTPKPVLSGWAAIVAKPVPIAPIAVKKESTFTELSSRSYSVADVPLRVREKTPSIAEGLEPAPAFIPKPILSRSEALGRPAPVRRKPGKSWADDSSDEEVEMETAFEYVTKFEYTMADLQKGTVRDFDPTW
jgi:hypothetical protein